MPRVAARLEQIVELPHLLRGTDVDGVLRLDFLRAVAGDESEMFDLVVKLRELEFDRRIVFEVV